MTQVKKALICGISGQDGPYLAQLLLQKGYQVYGTSRDAQASSFHNLALLGIMDQIETLSVTLTDFRSVLQAISKIRPDEIYNLAGQSSVGLSFSQPVEALESIALGTLNLLEVIRFLDYPTRIYNAGSSECFGDTGENAANEDTPFRPLSPYAVAKSTSHWETASYRDAYDIFACTGILYNHESPLRPERFVTRKIIRGACDIASGKQQRLQLGNLSICRDWGYAPEYIDAMWRMLQQEKAEDFVIATGESHSLEAFCATAFELLSLNWKDHVDVNQSFFRPSDIMTGRGDATKAKEKLNWQAQTHMRGVIQIMLDAELTSFNA